MNKEEIHLYDIQRILFGNAPVSFLLETLIRTFIVYAVLIIVLRIMGSRMSGQLTITELAIMLMLGAIVSSAVEMPDKGILWGVAALIVILLLQQGLTYWTTKNEKVEKATQGVMGILIKDGVLQLDVMKRSSISKEQVFAVLRNRKILNLGKVKRLYLEGCGDFSTYLFNESREGLSIMPEIDPVIRKEQLRNSNGTKVCGKCGALKNTNANECTVCGEDNWVNAVNE
jgi:uncharacterized membrane protein YcaP (DUF421 family)